jgi:DNA recombination protein RmuC
MDKLLITIGGVGLTGADVALVLLALTLLAVLVVARRSSQANMVLREQTAAAAERQRELDDKIALLLQSQNQFTGRMSQIGESLESRQSNLARLLNDRIDGLNNRLGEGLTANLKNTHENLSKLNERLAVIDEAQKRLGDLTTEMLSLKDVLSNKQTRGAFGQGRMEAIVKDALPIGAYEFQATLANGKRPDCLIRLPGDDRPLVVDAKFPLEAFTAFREAQGDEARALAGRRIRNDIGIHIKDVADKYLIPGATQDLAILFVPAESIYADLQEHFEDLVQGAHRRRVLIVSPSLLTMAIQVMQAIVRDAKMREQAHMIQDEVRKLLEDVGRLKDRVGKLDTHFRQAQDDVGQITTSADKILKRGERIDAMDFRPVAAPADREALPAAEGRPAA